MAYLYVPGSEDLNSDSRSPSETPIAVYVTSSGKGTLRQPSWRGWQTRPWIRLLSGTISRPLMAAHGAERWISSLEDSRASPQATPEGERGPRTNVGSGRSSRSEFARYDPPTSSWRMYRGSSLSTTDALSERYSETWPN